MFSPGAKETPGISGAEKSFGVGRNFTGSK